MVERSLRSRKSRAKAVSILCSLAAGFAGSVGCSNDADRPVSNTVRFELDLGGGVTLTSIDYRLTGPNGFRRNGSLPVGNDPIVTATFQNLPPGQGYNIEVRGDASDEETRCEGALSFNVAASMTATLQIPLTCRGHVTIIGAVNLCPVTDSLSAIPAEVGVGGSIDIAVQAHDDDNGPQPLSATWTTTGGALSSSSTSGATFTCTQPGMFSVGVKISDGDTTNRCTHNGMLILVCTPATSAAMVASSRREGAV